jgi:hypothetical protein
MRRELVIDDGLLAAKPSDVDEQLTVVYEVEQLAALLIEHTSADAGRAYLTRAETQLAPLARAATNAEQRDRLAKLTALSLTITREFHEQGAWDNIILARGDVALVEARSYIELAGWKDDAAAYMAVVGHLAAIQAGQAADGASLLARCSAECDQTKWPYPVVQYLRREIAASQLVDRAADNDRRTEAHTYIGMDLAETGHKDEALVHLRWVAEHGNKDFLEYRLARAELARLGELSARPEDAFQVAPPLAGGIGCRVAR